MKQKQNSVMNEEEMRSIIDNCTLLKKQKSMNERFFQKRQHEIKVLERMKTKELNQYYENQIKLIKEQMKSRQEKQDKNTQQKQLQDEKRLNFLQEEQRKLQKQQIQQQINKDFYNQKLVLQKKFYSDQKMNQSVLVEPDINSFDTDLKNEYNAAKKNIEYTIKDIQLSQRAQYLYQQKQNLSKTNQMQQSQVIQQHQEKAEEIEQQKVKKTAQKIDGYFQQLQNFYKRRDDELQQFYQVQKDVDNHIKQVLQKNEEMQNKLKMMRQQKINNKNQQLDSYNQLQKSMQDLAKDLKKTYFNQIKQKIRNLETFREEERKNLERKFEMKMQKVDLILNEKNNYSKARKEFEHQLELDRIQFKKSLQQSQIKNNYDLNKTEMKHSVSQSFYKVKSTCSPMTKSKVYSEY